MMRFVLACMFVACKTDNAPAPQPAPSPSPSGPSPSAPVPTPPPTPSESATPPTPAPSLPTAADPTAPDTAKILEQQLARVDPNPPSFVTPPSQAVLEGLRPFCATDDMTVDDAKAALAKWEAEVLPNNPELAELWGKARDKADPQAIGALRRAAAKASATCKVLETVLTPRTP